LDSQTGAGRASGADLRRAQAVEEEPMMELAGTSFAEAPVESLRRVTGARDAPVDWPHKGGPV
jgi:hypothetical protein